MCCHEHPDNGHGLALEKVNSLPSSPWTLEDLRALVAEYDASGDGAGEYRPDEFLDWLKEQA